MTIKENWLTRKPQRRALYSTLFSVLVLLLGTLVYLNNLFEATTLMPASYVSVFKQFQIWRLWTTLFAHADIQHVMSNLILFLPFAYYLASYFGFFFFPVFAFFSGGCINFVVLNTMPGDVNLIGVSGVVHWMGAAWMTLAFLIDRRESWRRRLLKVLGVSLILFIPDTFKLEVSYLSHFIGYLFGVLCALMYYLFFFRKFRDAEVLEIEHDDLELRES
ncbi:MAG: rhomboid family intramembrane serine protease [Bdellovibrio sp.]|nr:rhomboid family intramembrane serine protease [Bdellovibrio sp.]